MLGRRGSSSSSSIDPIERSLAVMDRIIAKLPPLPAVWTVSLAEGDTELPYSRQPIYWEQTGPMRWANAQSIQFAPLPRSMTITGLAIQNGVGQWMFTVPLGPGPTTVNPGDSVRLEKGFLTIDWPFNIPPESFDPGR